MLNILVSPFIQPLLATFTHMTTVGVIIIIINVIIIINYIYIYCIAHFSYGYVQMHCLAHCIMYVGCVFSS